MKFLLIFSFNMALSLLLLLLTLTLTKKTLFNKEKLSPFECGFDPFSPTRTPFSLRFFLIAIIFLIFDVEIAILLPAPFTPLMNSQSQTTITFFIIILILGLLHEWHQGALEWIK